MDILWRIYLFFSKGFTKALCMHILTKANQRFINLMFQNSPTRPQFCLEYQQEKQLFVNNKILQDIFSELFGAEFKYVNGVS